MAVHELKKPLELRGFFVAKKVGSPVIRAQLGT
jgi:hypothetical protein